MELLLKHIDLETINKELKDSKIREIPTTILYVDFNVLNFFYIKKYNLDLLYDIHLYPDSTAMYLFIKWFIDSRFKKIVSTNLQDNLLGLINENKYSIYLFGDENYILKKIIKIFRVKYPDIIIEGFNNGYNYSTEKIIEEINMKNIDVLFVGLGLERQEEWIIKNKNKINVKIIMSVGGWFQYLAKKKNRAPLILQKIHLEWLHKLSNEFSRVWRRYLIGFPIFIIRIFSRRIIIKLEK